MQLTKLDDYQSWLIEAGGRKILVDPWLTDRFAFPQGSWLFARDRYQAQTQPLPTSDALFLTAHFADHLNPDTLAQIDKATPVYGSKTAAKIAKKLGFTRTHALKPGDSVPVGNARIDIVAPGFPYSHNSIGAVFRDSGGSAYLETHTVNTQRAPKVDVLITTMESVRLLGIQLAMDADRTLGVVQSVAPRYIVPTGNRPGHSTGLLSKLLHVRGSVDAFKEALARSQLPTQLADLAPGQTLSL